jgi:hypothetical protein
MHVDRMRRQSADNKVWAGSSHGAVFATKTSTGASAHVLDLVLASPTLMEPTRGRRVRTERTPSSADERVG